MRWFLCWLRLDRSNDILSALEFPLRAQDLVGSMDASRKVIDRHLAHLTSGGVLEREGFRYSPSKLYNRFVGGKGF
jgi:DNA-binding HxlR family transcriptional regulator